MCLICIDLDRAAMNVKEARRALGEMRIELDAKHFEQVEQRLDEAEAEEAEAP